MSKFLETPDGVLSNEALFNILQQYVLYELANCITPPGAKSYLSDNGEKTIQNYMDRSNHKLRMYGTAKELAENLKVFRNFPEAHRYFRTQHDLYNASAVIYESLKGEKYISKQDIFIVLQNMALEIFPDSKSLEMRISIMTPLRVEDTKNPKLLEFVKFDERIFDEMEMEMRKVAAEFITTKSQISQIEQELAAGNYKGFIQRLPKFNGKFMSHTEEMEMINRLKPLCDKLGSKKRVDWMIQFFNKTSAMKCLQAIISNRPAMFAPGPTRAVLVKKQTQTIRLFEDGDQKFMMKAELHSALSRLKGNKSTFQDKPHMFTTISLEEVQRSYESKISKIEFIRTPILRAKHHGVLVKGDVAGEFGYLAADALLDVLKNFILGNQFFQRAKLMSLEPLMDIFDDALDAIFEPNVNTPYFIRQGMVAITIANFKEMFELAGAVLTAKTIRNARPDGFTLQNLKSELVYLDLHFAFPEIQDHAEVVYAHVDKVKKEKVLRTCDLIDAVENCQLICFFERLPKYKKFLHNQGGCGRVPGLKCELCDVEKTEDQEAKDTLKVEGPPNTSSIETNTVKALAPAGSQKEDLKASELERVNLKIASLEAQLASQAEKSTKIESDLLKKTQDNEELQVSNIKLQSENEANKGMISQLIDKLSIKGSGQESAICLN